MFAAVITALLLGVMALIIAGLIANAWLERKRYARAVVRQTQAITSPLNAPETLILPVQVEVDKPEVVPAFTLPSSWYTHRRTLVSLGFLLMLLLALFVQGALVDGTLPWQSLGKGITFLNYNQPADVHTVAHPMDYTASQLLVRVDSADRSQYYNDYQWHVWSYSSCSGIAMEMVMNAYGRHLIAADVLTEELKLGVWSVQMGLLSDEGIVLTAAYFGFNASLSHSRTLNDLIALSNKGFPLIVSVRDYYYFPGGHIFVVRGGDSQYVYIADSSPANFQRMTRTVFLGMWQGESFSALLTPR